MSLQPCNASLPVCFISGIIKNVVSPSMFPIDNRIRVYFTFFGLLIENWWN